MIRKPKPVLKPTVWRTCRVLASPVRLRILQSLFLGKELPVSAVAAKVGISPTLASEYLRALGARGLLIARQQSRWVLYRPGSDPSILGTDELLRALRKELGHGRGGIACVFRQVTAFTHPRRVAIARALGSGALPTIALARRTGISRIALQRHLSKLFRRGFVTESEGLWRLVCPRQLLAATLVRLASGR